MLYNCVTLSQRPELEAKMPRLHSEIWPEFVLNDPITVRYFSPIEIDREQNLGHYEEANIWRHYENVLST